MLSVTLVDTGGKRRITALSCPDPSAWSIEDAREFVWAVWQLLGVRGAYGLRLTEGESRSVQLEFRGDAGKACVRLQRLSSEALTWLQVAQFDLVVARIPIH